MTHIVVRFPRTYGVCFVWAQAMMLSILVNGI